MRGQPDYVGAWNRARFDELPTSYHPERLSANESSLFYIFIESENGPDFTGTSEDYRGTARIKGSKLSGFIIFTKQYNKAAIEKGGRKDKMTYKAVRTAIGNPDEEFFAGLITSEKADPLPFIMKSLT
ncbi:hypothetical protein A3K73_06530 [Candidatus Pacearchaeota archaeon RBG_13_36_9]|nr:MAG: hypothetical protein A3K73_06530 [Candidatus Pacearchaeota archaeon RBG_13_36_9]